MEQENHNIEGAKEQLSQHVKNIFKGYTTDGLHVCDIATGGGKSYTIGELTCTYYPQYFDRIIILCVQNKLVDGMNKEIDRFINAEESLIESEEKIVIENNLEVITKAIQGNFFVRLLEEMDYQAEKMSEEDTDRKLRNAYKWVKKCYDVVASLFNHTDTSKGDMLFQIKEEKEGELRKAVRKFFELYMSYIGKKQKKKVSRDSILKIFPSLEKVFPQVKYKTARVLLMTIHKGMYGIDPILTEKVNIEDLAWEKKKTLMLFDESDQASMAMKDIILSQSIKSSGSTKRFEKGYNEYLHFLELFNNLDHVSTDYYEGRFEKELNKAKIITQANWEKGFGKVSPYRNIFLAEKEDIETYRRGVFFSGNTIRLNISDKRKKVNSYICHRKGDKHLSLVHSVDGEELKSKFDIVKSIDNFLSLSHGNTTLIKSKLASIIWSMYRSNMDKFSKEDKKIATNTADKNLFLGYPTLEREIYTLFSRFETSSQYLREQQMTEYITNRKNIAFHDGDSQIKLQDYSVYFQGVQLYQEELDDKDNQHRLRISCREITTTAEKILYNIASAPNTTVVLCSATASSPSVVSNFDMKHLRYILGDKFHSLPVDDRKRFDELMAKTYPKGHKTEIVRLGKYELEDGNITFPAKYREMFCKEAIEEGYVDGWFKCTVRELKRNKNNMNDVAYRLYRLFQFVEAYKFFYDHGDIQSMLFFQNRTGDKDKNQVNVISCMIDGSYKDKPSFKRMKDPKDWEAIPSDCDNECIRISKNMDEIDLILEELEKNKDKKIMLVAAYNSFKAGTNLQYKIPEGVDCLKGDNWEGEMEQKKDWDAIYLQCPTAYLMFEDDSNEQTYEKNLYNAMLTLMMLYERGCLGLADVKDWLYKAIANTFWFSDKNNLGVKLDKSAWAQNIIEQATGRICRTKNKSHTTYILFDEAIIPYFNNGAIEKSMTKEYKALVDYIQALPRDVQSTDADPNEVIRCNDANYSRMQLKRVLRQALRYSTIVEDDDIYESDDVAGDELSQKVTNAQIMNESFKKTIIRKPVISSIDELEVEDKKLTFINRCYGDWPRNERNELYCRYDPQYNNQMCPTGKGRLYPHPISPSSVRLETLMKNKVIRDYFEKNGYATDWKSGGLILHPEILSTTYTGEIGEEAFKALVLHYTGCAEDRFVHLQGKDYEEADFVVLNPDGSYKIAFDVKNMNPNFRHDDRLGDMPTSEKRKIKKKKLKCEVIIVNILQMKEPSMDANHEITGVIDEDGKIIKHEIQRLITFING